jgi:hypothetical protein
LRFQQGHRNDQDQKWPIRPIRQHEPRGGFDLGSGGSSGRARCCEPEDGDKIAAPTSSPTAPHIPALTFCLVGDRGFAAGWKARAADNIAAIRLARQIEDEAPPATADEQSLLAKFTGFGATELANSFFSRAGEGFRPDWEDLGNALEQLVSREEMAALVCASDDNKVFFSFRYLPFQ